MNTDDRRDDDKLAGEITQARDDFLTEYKTICKKYGVMVSCVDGNPVLIMAHKERDVETHVKQIRGHSIYPG